MLNEIVKNYLKHNGFITIDTFMSLALTNKDYGYYTTNLPLGKKNDFITSPEISQLFGEMLGFYIIHIWEKLNQPKVFHLVELGAGNGSCMLDALNIIQKVPEVFRGLKVHLVEISPGLTKIQKEKLNYFKNLITWHKALEDITFKHPIIFMANEFFDALPAKQFKYINQKWHEVVIKEDGAQPHNLHNLKLVFALNQESVDLSHLLTKDFKPLEGMVFEYSPQALQILKNITHLLQKQKGVALIIDYGYTENSFQSTLQAIAKHQQVDFLSNIGNQDLTALVNFPLLLKYLYRYKQDFSMFITTQRDFLLTLGIKERLKFLLQNVLNNEKNDIISGVERIIAENGMGTLFKVMVFGSKHLL